ncbi:MAG: NADP-dependent oxidoreductase [Gammaproteobacteria bacterium]
MQQMNHQVVLVRPLSGVPVAEDFRVQAVPVPEPAPGELLIRQVYLSLDPYQRSAIAGRHMARQQPLGAGDMPMAETVGQVLRSRHPGYREGDYVRHFGGWQEYALSSGAQTEVLVRSRAPLSTWLGVLGMPGLTAWASMVELADVQPGQVVLVSAALGPVGSMVGQIAMQRGAVAVGIAGSDEKCAFVRELGFSACVNYRTADFLQTLAAALPAGADIYHDNVGGQMLADAFTVLKNYGTVILCGLMERYNDPARSRPLDLALPIVKRAVMKGLVVMDFEDRRTAFVDFVAPRIADGRIRYREDRASGIEATGAHFARLMRGANLGKSIVVLADEAA